MRDERRRRIPRRPRARRRRRAAAAAGAPRAGSPARSRCCWCSRRWRSARLVGAAQRAPAAPGCWPGCRGLRSPRRRARCRRLRGRAHRVTLPGSGDAAPRRRRAGAACASSARARRRWLRIDDRPRCAPIASTCCSASASAAGERADAADDLRLPLELDDRAPLASASCSSAPRRRQRRCATLRARLHLGAERGALHRIDELRAGARRAAARRVAARSAPTRRSRSRRVVERRSRRRRARRPWQRDARRATGPLGGCDGRLQAARVAARAAARPGAVARLRARRCGRSPPGRSASCRRATQALDLSAFASRRAGDRAERPRGRDEQRPRPAGARRARPDQRRAGRWDEGRLPVRELRARAARPARRPEHARAADASRRRSAARQPRRRPHVGQRPLDADRWTLDADADSAAAGAARRARAARLLLGGKLGARRQRLRGGALEAAARSTLARRPGRRSSPTARRPRSVPRVDAAARRSRAALQRDRAARRRGAALGGARRERSPARACARGRANAPWQAPRQARRWPTSTRRPGGRARADSPWRSGPHRLNATGRVRRSTLRRPAADAPRLHELLAATARQAPSSRRRQPARRRAAAGRGELAQQRRHARGSSTSTPPATASRRGPLRRPRPAPATAGSCGSTRRARAARAAVAAAASAAGRRRGAGRRAERAKAHVDGRWPALATGAAELARRRAAGGDAAHRGLALRAAKAAGASAAPPMRRLDGTLSARRRRRSAQARDRARARRLERHARARTGSSCAPSRPRCRRRGPMRSRRRAASDAAAPARAPRSSHERPPRAPRRHGSRASQPERRRLVDAGAERAAGWRGTLQRARSRKASAPEPHLAARARARAAAAAGPAGRRAPSSSPAAPRCSARAALEPHRLAGAPTRRGGRRAARRCRPSSSRCRSRRCWRALQPDFGWGGDLAVGGRIDVRSAPTFEADIVLERAARRSDASPTRCGTQALGLTDLRLGSPRSDGIWNFTQALAGTDARRRRRRGRRAHRAAGAWPTRRHADRGRARAAGRQPRHLGPLGAAGLAARRRRCAPAPASAARFGAPEYTGEVERPRPRRAQLPAGRRRQRRRGGDRAAAAHGAHRALHRARRRRHAAARRRAPASARRRRRGCALTAERFQLLGRVDRRIVASGDAALRLDAKTLGARRPLRVDEGLIDFSRSRRAERSATTSRWSRRPARRRRRRRPGRRGGRAGAPRRRLPPTRARSRSTCASTWARSCACAAAASTPACAASCTSPRPAAAWRVNGTVRTVDGTYAAYGQKLDIERGAAHLQRPGREPAPRHRGDAAEPRRAGRRARHRHAR